MNEISKRWNETGLLDELQSDTQKDECAEVLNHVAQILIRDDPNPTDKERKKQHEEFCGFILPMTRRIYDCLYPSKIKFPDVEWFVKDCGEFFDNNQDLYDAFNSYIALDAEAEMCAMYESVCLNKIKWKMT